MGRPIKRPVPAHKREEREPEPFYDALERENEAVAAAPAQAPLRCHYRPIQPGDTHQLKYLHERWFPLRYDPKFYDGVVSGNWNGRHVYTLAAFALEPRIASGHRAAEGDGDGGVDPVVLLAGGGGGEDRAVSGGAPPPSGSGTGPSPASAEACSCCCNFGRSNRSRVSEILCGSGCVVVHRVP